MAAEKRMTQDLLNPWPPHPLRQIQPPPKDYVAQAPYCHYCKRREGDRCDILGQITERVVRDCRSAGYRDLPALAGLVTQRHSSSTGDWAVVLEGK